MLTYRIQIKKSPTGYIATCQDMDKFLAAARHSQDLIEQAQNAFIAAVERYIDEKIPVPLPADQGQSGEKITLNLLTELKIALYNALLEAGITKNEFARRMNMNNQNINTLLNVKRATRIDTLEKAFHQPGKTLTINIV